jgi:hypothetical protein
MLIAFPRQKWLSASKLRYTHIACFVKEIVEHTDYLIAIVCVCVCVCVHVCVGMRERHISTSETSDQILLYLIGYEICRPR